MSKNEPLNEDVFEVLKEKGFATKDDFTKWTEDIKKMIEASKEQHTTNSHKDKEETKPVKLPIPKAVKDHWCTDCGKIHMNNGHTPYKKPDKHCKTCGNNTTEAECEFCGSKTNKIRKIITEPNEADKDKEEDDDVNYDDDGDDDYD